MRSSLAFLAAVAMLALASWLLRRAKRKRRSAGPWPVLLIVLGVGLLAFVAADALLP